MAMATAAEKCVKLFEVTRWGNDIEGGNGPDTNYLVCAHDHEEAAHLIQAREPRLDAITELGVCSAQVLQPVLLRGPYIEHKIEKGTFFILWSWDAYELKVWIPTARCWEGEALCYYANNQLAAQCTWQNGRQHGKTLLWYNNGQLMHQGEYQQNKRFGIHKWWYDNSTLASHYEYTTHGVRYQKWNRSGQLVTDATEQ